VCSLKESWNSLNESWNSDHKFCLFKTIQKLGNKKTITIIKIVWIQFIDIIEWVEIIDYFCCKFYWKYKLNCFE